MSSNKDKYFNLSINDGYKEKVVEEDGTIWFRSCSKIMDWLFQQAREYRENDPERKEGGIKFRFNEYKEPLMKELRLKQSTSTLYELKDIAERLNVNIYELIFSEKKKNKLIFDPLIGEVEVKFFEDILEILRKKVD